MTYSTMTSSGRTQLVGCDETVLGEWNASNDRGEACKDHAREVEKLHAEDSSRTEEKMEWSVSVKELVVRWEREREERDWRKGGSREGVVK
jgi:hypothetical protein